MLERVLDERAADTQNPPIVAERVRLQRLDLEGMRRCGRDRAKLLGRDPAPPRRDRRCCARCASGRRRDASGRADPRRALKTVTCSPIVSRNSRRVASSSSSSVSSSMKPRSEKSGVRSSCDALPTNSRRAARAATGEAACGRRRARAHPARPSGDRRSARRSGRPRSARPPLPAAAIRRANNDAIQYPGRARARVRGGRLRPRGAEPCGRCPAHRRARRRAGRRRPSDGASDEAAGTATSANSSSPRRTVPDVSLNVSAARCATESDLTSLESIVLSPRRARGSAPTGRAGV